MLLIIVIAAVITIICMLVIIHKLSEKKQVLEVQNLYYRLKESREKHCYTNVYEFKTYKNGVLHFVGLTSLDVCLALIECDMDKNQELHKIDVMTPYST